jgi:hypothetical protein
MKKKSTSINLQSEAKIIKGLNYLRNNFSKSIGQPWDSEALYQEVSITRTFATILKNMGVIEYPKKGHIKLTEKIDTITPREIHKEINAYQTASQKRNKKIKDKIKAQELAKIQAQIRFENKQKLRGTNNDNGYQEALRNAVPPPQQLIGTSSGYTAIIDQEKLRNVPATNVQGAYYPSTIPISVTEAMAILKNALRAEIKEELRREIINELVSKG